MNRRQFSAAVSSLAVGAAAQPPSQADSDDPAARLDRGGDPLPPHAMVRLGTTRFWNASGIAALAIASDGRLIATADADSTITLWDPATGAVVRRLVQDPVPDGGIFRATPRLTFTPEGTILAVSRGVKRRPPAHGQILPALGGDPIRGIGAVGLAPVPALANARGEGFIDRWDQATGRKLPPLGGHGEFIVAIAYSADGKTLASCDTDGLILLRDAATGQVRHRIEVPGGSSGWGSQLVGIALARDGSKLVACGYHDVPITLWDTASGRLLWTSTPPRHCLMFRDSVAIARDGATIAVGAAFEIGIFDAKSGRFRFMLRPQPGQEPGEADIDYKTYARVWAMAFAPDGKTLASTSANDAVRLWDPIRPALIDDRQAHRLPGVPERTRFDWAEARPSGVAFSPDGTWLVSASASASGTIRIWDLPAATERTRPEGHRSEVLALAFAADGRTLVSAGEDNVCMWDPATGAMLRRNAVLPRICAVWAISPDGKFLAYQGLRGERFTNVVDLASGQIVRRIDQPPAESEITTLGFANDSRTLVFGISHLDDHFEMVLVDWSTGNEIRRFPQVKSGYFDKLLLASDGRTLASLGFTGVIVYDVATGRVRHWFKLADRNPDNTSQSFRSFALAPDGATLATTDEGGLIRCWNVVQGQEIRRIPAGLGQHDSLLTYAPNGKVIASASGGPYGGNKPTIIQLWDVASGRELTRFAGHPSTTTVLAFAPDGRRLASGSRDTTALIWDVSAWTG